MRTFCTRHWARPQSELQGEDSLAQAAELTVWPVHPGPCCTHVCTEGLAQTGIAVPATEGQEKLQGGGALKS